MRPSGLARGDLHRILALPRGELRRELWSSLRQAKPLRGRKPKGSERRGKLVGMTNIKERPEEIEGRLVPDHWEGDVILCAGGASAIGTLVERTIRPVVLVHRATRKADVACHSRAPSKDADLRPGARKWLDTQAWPRGRACASSLPIHTRLAARLQREHQRPAASVPNQGRFPGRAGPRRPRPRRRQPQRPAQQDNRLRHAERGLQQPTCQTGQRGRDNERWWHSLRNLNPPVGEQRVLTARLQRPYRCQHAHRRI